MVEARFPSTLQERRKTLSQNIENCIKIIDKSSSSDGVDPYIKHKLAELYKLVNELQAIDNVVPQIIKNLSEKPEEFCKELAPIIQDFLSKIEGINKDFEQNTSNDSSNKLFYDKIDRDDPNIIRVRKQNIDLTNGILSSLKPGKFLHPSIVHVYLLSLKEKSETINETLPEGEKIAIYGQPIELYGGEDMLYGELGPGKNLREIYRRMGYIFHVDLSHFILVELINGDNKSELIIYDSDLKEYEHTHTKLKALFSEVVGEDEMDKTATMYFGGTRNKFASSTLGNEKNLQTRAANCPQQMNAFDSAVFALKNAYLLTDNKKIMQGSYTQNEINAFRYEIFNNVIKAGKIDEANFTHNGKFLQSL